ncbi:LysR family transcriptional regulator [Vibrio gazogenes]|uniref:LysR family transcriptional regulator n=1 Tax=Vibrio gazogenes TaxID=687 RepID=UPI0009324E84|nr:LysR family transcriptional regulator [Vibrio gazogenes]USP12500.1 LysR family transcriptional regulator [Vibrio gazogenes]
MKRDLPPLNSLRIFEMIAGYPSFSKAAEENHMTKGAISQQIKILEDWYGITLFNRSKAGIELTEVGNILLNKCQSVFSELEFISVNIKRSSPRTVLEHRLFYKPVK